MRKAHNDDDGEAEKRNGRVVVHFLGSIDFRSCFSEIVDEVVVVVDAWRMG